MIPFPFVLFEEQRWKPSFLSLNHNPWTVGQANWWSPSGPNLQSNPPQEASSFREVRCQVPQTWTCGTKSTNLGEGLISQEEHSQQAVVGGGSKLGAGKREEWVTPLCGVVIPNTAKASKHFLPLTTLTTVQQPLCVGYWVTGQKGFRTEGEDTASI